MEFLKSTERLSKEAQNGGYDMWCLLNIQSTPKCFLSFSLQSKKCYEV